MTHVEALLFDPTSAAFHEDRYGVYRALRDRAPLHEMPAPQPTVLLTRYADIDMVLRDRTVRMLPEGASAPPWLGSGAAAEMYLGQMLYTDPPGHTRLRRVTSPAFRPRTISRLQAAVNAAMDERIAVVREMGSFDVVSELAEHVPAVAVCTILGIPESDWPELIRGAVDFVHILSPIPPTPGQLDRTERICAFYLDYFRNLVADRRRHPGDDDDFLTALIRAFDAGDISERELLVTAHSVLNAGFETTMSALANGLQGLLSQPGAWAALAAEPSRSAAVAEEALRWEAPAQLLTRYAAESLELPSGQIASGTFFVLAVASGNRDERRFPEPDIFDLNRDASGHLSFSAGRHACIGAHLGRMELDIAFGKLAAAFPEFRLADDAQATREPNPVFPTLRRLDVAVTA